MQGADDLRQKILELAERAAQAAVAAERIPGSRRMATRIEKMRIAARAEAYKSATTGQAYQGAAIGLAPTAPVKLRDRSTNPQPAAKPADDTF